MRKALIFGGGGFIGSNYYMAHASDFHSVTIVDQFCGPSHSTLQEFDRLSSSLRPQDKLFTTDVSQIKHWPELFHDVTDIFILNADTGTGRSYDRPSLTIDQNLSRLSKLIEVIRNSCSPTTRVIFTSSRAVYGEGRWACAEHGLQQPDRSINALTSGCFIPQCSICNTVLDLEGSLENDIHRPLSVYGLTKSTGELLLRMTLCASGYDVRIVRYQNVYGIGQAIDNPYTGVLNWFSTALLEGKPIKVYEQGLIVRDFVFISDAVELLHCLATVDRNCNTVEPLIINGGTGVPTKLVDAAKLLKHLYSSSSPIVSTTDYRHGDVLGAVANTASAKIQLGFKSQVCFEEGLTRYAEWFQDSYKAR
jgi:dTDP-L-rhamnose 4-epimerase